MAHFVGHAAHIRTCSSMTIQWDFLIGFWISAGNKLCGKQVIMIHFVQIILTKTTFMICEA